ncbi:Protein of unknown function DUF273 family-containing protein [Strongyloides ratti]|uniref:Uncharacterized protein n=1 Tax=Strongyloides ratti TaxID=34506 RepID=A0A090MU78_STRRB|nr:Protein of unknown function DUF273 family-containing protein [Strongyloides ratti]CEF62048.1 Protein of unknown function DUF273 family-containing protein [Strongyloides ratti]
MIFDNNNLTNYAQAIKTVECYCLHYNYTFEVIITTNTNYNLLIGCDQIDFMFKRHCIVSNYGLKFADSIKYIVFLDGDMGVVNPLHRIEEYLPRNEEEILFYDRVFNSEVAAGSYIIKNDFYARNFLKYFANYDFKIPMMNDGRDNVALQVVLINSIGPKKYKSEYEQCMKIYNYSVGFDQNMIVVSCFKWILNKLDETPNDINHYAFNKGKIKIIRKLSMRKWVRDTWLTGWRFCDNDFLHHGWKMHEIKKSHRIIKTEFDSSTDLCKSSDFLLGWNYNLSLKVNCEEVTSEIKNWIKYANDTYAKNVFLSNVTKELFIQ